MYVCGFIWRQPGSDSPSSWVQQPDLPEVDGSTEDSATLSLPLLSQLIKKAEFHLVGHALGRLEPAAPSNRVPSAKRSQPATLFNGHGTRKAPPSHDSVQALTSLPLPTSSSGPSGEDLMQTYLAARQLGQTDAASLEGVAAAPKVLRLPSLASGPSSTSVFGFPSQAGSVIDPHRRVGASLVSQARSRW